MKFQRLRYIFMLVPMIFSLLLASCGLPLDINETPTANSGIEIRVSPSVTPTKAFIPARIPKEYLPPEEFSGYYTASFEVSSFVPCSENDLPGYAKGYWIDIFRSPSFYEKYNTLVAEKNQNANQTEKTHAIVFVRFVGQLSNPLSIEVHHGHMGLYKPEIMVIELIEMKSMEENQCIST